MPAKCTLVFVNLDQAEHERVKGLIAAKAVDGAVEETTAQDGMVTMTFTLADITLLPALAQDVRYRTAEDGTKTLVFEEAGREFASSFRAAKISGAIKVSVTFSVAPGATLYYSPKAGEEVELPADVIDDQGKVDMDVAIVRGQEFIYARTVLGEVERCVKIDIFTAAATDVTRAAYDAHQ